MSEGNTGVELKDLSSVTLSVVAAAMNLPPFRRRSRLSTFSGMVTNAKDPIRANARGTARSKSLGGGKKEEVVVEGIGISKFSVAVLINDGDGGGSDVDEAMMASTRLFPTSFNDYVS